MNSLTTNIKTILCALLLCFTVLFCTACSSSNNESGTPNETETSLPAQKQSSPANKIASSETNNSGEKANNAASENGTKTNELSVYFLDVGQGDSEFIVLPDGKTMLIDAGESDQGSGVKSFIQDLGYSKIDYIVATHPHSDHIGGLPLIISSFDIGEVWAPKVTHTSKTYEAFLDSVINKNLSITPATQGTIISDENNCQVEILSPNDSKNYNNLNDWSVIIKITYDTESFLFTGDASSSVISASNPGRINVLKVGHHGSKTSTTNSLIAALQPQWAIIEVGANNDYGHPTEQALSALKKNSVEVFRTDLNGTCTATSDGKSIQWKTEK